MHKNNAAKANLKKALEASGIIAAPLSQIEFKLEKNLVQNSSDEENYPHVDITDKEAALHTNVPSKLFELQLDKKSDEEEQKHRARIAE